MVRDFAAMTNEELDQELEAARSQLHAAAHMEDLASYRAQTEGAKERIAEATAEFERRRLLRATAPG